MNEQMVNDFLTGKCKWILYIIKACSIHEYVFVYVVEAFVTLN